MSIKKNDAKKMWDFLHEDPNEEDYEDEFGAERAQLFIASIYPAFLLHMNMGSDFPSEKVQLKALSLSWDKELYDFVMNMPEPKSEWFMRELNKLKLINGVLANE